MSDNAAIITGILIVVLGGVLIAAAIAIPISVASYHVRRAAFENGYEQEQALGAHSWHWKKATDD